MVTLLGMGSVSVSGRGREVKFHKSGRVEVRLPDGGRVDVRPGRRGGRHDFRPGHHDGRLMPPPVVRERGMARCGGHSFDRRWESRVRHDNGRWGYRRDSRWYWYDRYFEPDYYFSRPVSHFSCHVIPSDGRVVAGVAGGVALGVLIGSLCR